ncbi:hypothetical protein ABT294_19520 [Nonomuraea sp. NPDC000554]|uniref:hypothetical protein n=1 Tax=Nonomuraea sp. NPDC000554 TaxID=3154259 RepID=UPI003333B70F
MIIRGFKHADRYADDTFWRIPGGRIVAIGVSGIAIIGTTVGIHYTFTLPFRSDTESGTWMINLAAIRAVNSMICLRSGQLRSGRRFPVRQPQAWIERRGNG